MRNRNPLSKDIINALEYSWNYFMMSSQTNYILVPNDPKN